jgi:ATP-binding cassette subfamily C protein CydD
MRNQSAGEWLTTLIHRIDALDAYISQFLPQWYIAFLFPLVILFAAFTVDWFSAVVLFVTAPLIPLFMILIGHKTEQLTRTRWLSMSRLGGIFLDRIQGLITLKLLNQSGTQSGVIEQSTKQFAHRTMEVLRVAFLSGLVLELIASISIALIAVEIGLRVMHGMMDFQSALFILILAPEFYQPLRLLGSRFHSGMEGSTAMETITVKLNHSVENKITKTTGSPVIQPPFRIEFDSVSFRYSDNVSPALNGASFTILPNCRNALIGPSGSGKTTIHYLIMKWLTPDAGRITVNGQPLEDIATEHWESLISWIPQHPYMFCQTIGENIRFGKPEANDNDVEQAAFDAGLTEWINGLPAGMNTVIGEQGMKLSRGQIQRVAIARAFLKSAPLMIFDEPANYLDPDNERLINDSIERLSHNRTVISIAHRVHSVIQSGHIIMMRNGQCVGEGTHDELTNQSPDYRDWIGRYQGSADENH